MKNMNALPRFFHRLMKELPLLVLVALLAGSALSLFQASAVWAATPIYVRPDGNDTNCDGTTNDPYPDSGTGLSCAVRTIQQGINLVDSGGTINVAAGTYAPTTTINVNKAITFVGAGQGVTLVDAAGMPDLSYGILVTANQVNLQNFTLQNARSYGIKVQPPISPGTISNVTIQDVTVQNSARSNIDFNGVDNITVTDVVVTGTPYGVGLAITDGNGATISNITTSGNAWAGLAIYTSTYFPPAGSSNITLFGTNSFGELMPFYIQPTNPSDPITNIDITSDFHWTVRRTATPTTEAYFQTLAAAKNAVEALPTTISTSAIYDLDNARFFVPYKAVAPAYTIQAAVDVASTGDTVLVEDGTYVEQVKIGKSLTLVSTGDYTSTTIQAPASIPASSDQESNIVKISGAGVSVDISGFTIAGPGPMGCGSIRSGIFVRDGAEANIHHNRILDIRDSSFSGCQNGLGILVGRNAWSTNGMATIANNLIQGYQKGGIVVDNSGSNATITGNIVTGAGPTAITAQNGIQISRGATATVSNNTVNGHFYTLPDWTAAGVLIYQANTVDVNLNSFTGNQIGLDNSSTILVNATRNWWGSQTGPTHSSNTGGSGNSINDNVTFTPWLCDGADTSAAIGFQPNLTTLCAVPTRLVFTTQPGSSTAKNPLSVQPIVRAEDEAGNLGINFSGPVALVLNPSGATLNGVNPANAVNGVVTFNGLAVDTFGTYTLSASTLGLTGATSNSFSINQVIFLPTISKNH